MNTTLVIQYLRKLHLHFHLTSFAPQPQIPTILLQTTKHKSDLSLSHTHTLESITTKSTHTRRCKVHPDTHISDKSRIHVYRWENPHMPQLHPMAHVILHIPHPHQGSHMSPFGKYPLWATTWVGIEIHICHAYPMCSRGWPLLRKHDNGTHSKNK